MLVVGRWFGAETHRHSRSVFMLDGVGISVLTDKRVFGPGSKRRTNYLLASQRGRRNLSECFSHLLI